MPLKTTQTIKGRIRDVCKPREITKLSVASKSMSIPKTNFLTFKTTSFFTCILSIDALLMLATVYLGIFSFPLKTRRACARPSKQSKSYLSRNQRKPSLIFFFFLICMNYQVPSNSPQFSPRLISSWSYFCKRI